MGARSITGNHVYAEESRPNNQNPSTDYIFQKLSATCVENGIYFISMNTYKHMRKLKMKSE